MQQNQRFAQTNVNKLAMNNGGMSSLPATYNHIQIITAYQLKQLLGNFVRLLPLTINKKPLHHRQVPTTFSSSIFASNQNQNKEETTLIWCDKNIDIHDDTKKRTELLQQVNDYILICSNLDTCLEYINQIKTEKLFLILSGQSADEMIDKVHDYKQVDSIYIFCINNIKYEHYLKEDHEKYYKLVGIYTEHESLLRAIQENIRYLIKQSQATSLFEQDERSMRNLSSELHNFDAFRAFKYVLLKTDYDREQAKREMLETFNKALRTEDYEALLILRFFINDLCENLRLKYDDLKQRQEQLGSSTVVSYRGSKLSSPEIYNLKYNIGKSIATNGFLSTSRSKHVANIFAKKGAKRLGVETVIVEIHVDTTKLTTALADIAEYSDYPNEQEVLFDLGASFTIDNVTYDEKDKIWLVKLSSVSEEVLTNDIQTLLKRCTETEMNLLLGELLVRMGYYSKCRKYLENLFDLYGNEHEYMAKIYELIGWSYTDEKEYDQAILNYEKAFDRYSSSNRWEDASKVASDIAACYYGKEDKNAAKTCKCNHHDDKIVQIYENIGLTYRDDGNYVQTIVYFQESEKLRIKYVTFWKERKAYTQCLIKTYEICETKITSQEKQAQCLFDIGHRLLIDDKDYAFKFVSKALEIRLLVLKSDDVNIGFSHYDMAACYKTMNMFDMAIEHL
ncbi:unnamed protein product [Rotaria sordida]|uniref:ADP ribosyltransferase domain-containing protein n=1 Tax=Rotaria sordida TaxID=392033 RepID=A0A815FK85_9BILA|nr:unnamed protein product [Rotaria sordida]